MSTAPQSDYLSKCESDKLDKELDEIFEEMENAVKKAGISPENSLPSMGSIPDDLTSEYNEEDTQPLPEISPLKNKIMKQPPRRLEPIHLPDVAISQKDPAGTQLLSINLAVKSANMHSDLNLEAANTYQPTTHIFSTSKRPQEVPGAAAPPATKECEGHFTTTLTQEQLSQLIEKTVEKALIAAFKKYGSTG